MVNRTLVERSSMGGKLRNEEWHHMRAKLFGGRRVSIVGKNDWPKLPLDIRKRRLM